MKQSTSEGQFQGVVVDYLRGIRADVQVHSERAERSVPDLSVAVYNKDFWLELKYAEFNIEREYDRLRFKYCNRDQLEWLKRRSEAGSARCGILGYFRTKPAYRTHYLFFMTPHDYLRVIWNKNISAAAVILSGSVVGADLVRNGEELIDFILNATPGGLAQRS